MGGPAPTPALHCLWAATGTSAAGTGWGWTALCQQGQHRGRWAAGGSMEPMSSHPQTGPGPSPGPSPSLSLGSGLSCSTGGLQPWLCNTHQAQGPGWVEPGLPSFQQCSCPLACPRRATEAGWAQPKSPGRDRGNLPLPVGGPPIFCLPRSPVILNTPLPLSGA